MTELNMAYSLNNGDEIENYEDYEVKLPQKPVVQVKKPQQQQEKFTNYEFQQQQEQVQMHMQQQQAQPQIQQQQKRYPEYSFWDRMVMSKREVLKLFILSIVIILGISLEKIGCHYLTQYISSTDLTTFQEFLVRLSFPILVFIILWIIKSL
jgi:ABC-type bacteriocin/lantibiotic exporter with double-glycine peptidase domain